jgi:hypothetical protein
VNRVHMLRSLTAVRLLFLVGLACLCWGNLLWMDGAPRRAVAVDVAGFALLSACRVKERRLELALKESP